MSSGKTKSSPSKHNHVSVASDSNSLQTNHAKPKRKAPAAPGGGAVKSSKTGSGKSNTKVKRKVSSSSLKEEDRAGVKGKRKTSSTSSPLKEESDGEVKDNKLRRVVSPRKEQYSHLLDEMVGCGDMVLLEPLTEGNIIENLKKRYAAGDIYVSSSYKQEYNCSD